MSNILTAQDAIEAVFPNWFEQENYGDRFLSERDFPVYDDSADLSRVPNEDWEAIAEDFYSSEHDDRFM